MDKQSKKVEICVIERVAKVTSITVIVSIVARKPTVTPSFYYVFNISLSCNNNIRSFIGNTAISKKVAPVIHDA